MMKCTNCYSLFSITEKEHIEVWHRGQISVVVCPVCVTNVSKARITLQRSTSDEPFDYLQFAAVEMFKEDSNAKKDTQGRTESPVRDKKSRT